MGGAGTFAVVGARLVGGRDFARQIGWVVHAGRDFPPKAREEIDSWNVNTKYINVPDRATTRARNVYSGDFRNFEFLTPKTHVDHTMLGAEFLQAKVFHIIGTPERCISLVEGIQFHRNAIEQHHVLEHTHEKPMFVWEPMEHSCAPENLLQFRRAMKLIDVFSPNEDEFAKLIDYQLATSDILPPHIMDHWCLELIGDCELQALVVRLGARGAHVRTKEQRGRIIPAFYSSRIAEENPKVVDVTGGGNAFLGAYCLVLAESLNALGHIPDHYSLHGKAVLIGNVAASFIVEQVGMPKLDVGRPYEYSEQWNGESVAQRVSKYINLLSEQIPGSASSIKLDE